MLRHLPSLKNLLRATQFPGQYDVMEDTAVQFRAQNKADNPNVVGYRWEVVEGEGGKLLDGDGF